MPAQKVASMSAVPGSRIGFPRTRSGGCELEKASVLCVGRGGMRGGQSCGVDVPLGASVYLRLGADFQIFFDNGENLKTLRLNAGFLF